MKTNRIHISTRLALAVACLLALATTSKADLVSVDQPLTYDSQSARMSSTSEIFAFLSPDERTDFSKAEMAAASALDPELGGHDPALGTLHGMSIRQIVVFGLSLELKKTEHLALFHGWGALSFRYLILREPEPSKEGERQKEITSNEAAEKRQEAEVERISERIKYWLSRKPNKTPQTTTGSSAPSRV